MIYLLDEDAKFFPPPIDLPVEEREEDGIYAMGGSIDPDLMLDGYAQGIFQWSYYKVGIPQWFCPWERFVIFPDRVHVSHSMRTLLNRGEYDVTCDMAFGRVIEHCSQLRIGEYGAWLGPEMVKATKALHRRGYAHSVEVWRGDDLVGGLYGIEMLGAFMGESMFSLAPSASKVALIALCRLMEQRGGVFVDCQLETPHLRSMGGVHIPYEQYMAMLRHR